MDTGIDKDRLLADLQNSLPGVHCTTGDYGKDITFQYGYARVFIKNYRSWDPRVILTRKEGQGSPFPIVFPDEVLVPGEGQGEPLVDAMLDVLSTGRTLECGHGIGEPGEEVSLRSLQYFMPDGGCDIGWDHLIDDVLGEGEDSDRSPAWDLSPDYQRGAVWTQEQQSLFIGHVLRGGKVPLIYVQRYESGRNAPEGSEYWNLPSEVIDGQQRLRAIKAFMRDGVPARMYIDTEDRWVEFTYDQLTEQDRWNANLRSRIVFVDLTRAERLRFYLRLNAGGTPHTQEELDKVRNLLAKEG